MQAIAMRASCKSLAAKSSLSRPVGAGVRIAPQRRDLARAGPARNGRCACAAPGSRRHSADAPAPGRGAEESVKCTVIPQFPETTSGIGTLLEVGRRLKPALRRQVVRYNVAARADGEEMATSALEGPTRRLIIDRPTAAAVLLSALAVALANIPLGAILWLDLWPPATIGQENYTLFVTAFSMMRHG